MTLFNPIQRKRSLFSIFFIAALDNFGFGIIFILFAPLILDPSYGMMSTTSSIESRNFVLGALFSAFPLMQFFGAPILGDLADRFGRKKALYLSVIGTAVGYALSALAIEFHSVIWLITSRLLTGFLAGNLSICLSVIADLSDDEKSRGKNFGLVSVVWGVSWPLAMLAGGYLSDPKIFPLFNPAFPFWLTTFMTLLSLFALFFFFIETHQGEKKIHINLLKSFHQIAQALHVKSMRPYLIAILFWTLGWGLAIQWYGAFSIQRFQVTQELISWALIIQGVFWTIGGLFFNPLLLNRYSVQTTAWIGLAWATLFTFASSFFFTFWTSSFVWWIATPGSAFGMSNTLNLVSLAAPEEIQGKAMGFSQSMLSLGWFIVPMMGSVIGNLDMRLSYGISAFLLLISVLILVMHQKSLKARP